MCLNYAPRHTRYAGVEIQLHVFVASALDEGGQLQVPPALLPQKELSLLIGQEVGWAQEPIWTQWLREKFPPLLGNELRPSSP